GWGGGGWFWSAAATNDPEVFYLGGDVAGVYKTTDGGKNWKLVNNGLTNYGVYTLLVDPHQNATVYALTDTGLAKSDDGAASWRRLPQTEPSKFDIRCQRGTSIHAVAVDGQDRAQVWAGTPKGLLFKSSDGGESWQEVPFLPADAAAPAFTGKGSLVIAVDAPGHEWGQFARAEKVYGNATQDWSRGQALTAALRLPENAPKVEAQLVVQSGDSWLWQQSDWQALKPGEFTKIKYDLAQVKDLNAVHAVYVIMRATEGAFKGDVLCDTLALEVNGKPEILEDWEAKDNAQGWRAHNQDAKFRLAKSVRHSVKLSGAPIATVAADPKNGGVVYVTTLGKGVHRTADGGKTWAKMGLPARGRAVHVAPSAPLVVYAAMEGDGLYKSTDGGKAWQKVEGLKLPAKHRVVDVAVAPKNAEKIYCIISDGGWGGMVGASADGGNTWKIAKSLKRDMVGNPTLPAENDANGMHPISAVTNLIVCDPDGQRAFVSCNWSNFMTNDGGETWVESSRGADISCITDICFHNGKVYATAMDEGLLSSADDGKTWKQEHPMKWVDELSGHSWRVVAWGDKGAEVVLATRSPWNNNHPNLVLRAENGAEPVPVKAGLPAYRSHSNCMWGISYARALAIDPNHPGTAYLGIDGDAEKGNEALGIYKTTDGGKTWEHLPGQPASRRMYFGLAVDPTDSNRLYWGACAENGGVHLSEDGGKTWKRVFSQDQWIFNLEVAADGTAYACGGSLYRSKDHGKTWEALAKAKDGTTVVGFASHPQQPDTFWYSTTPWDGNAKGGIFETRDGGKTWRDITGDIPYRRPQVLRFNPATSELWSGYVTINKTKIK
ncbi:MAG: hypothetical protein J6333_01655, partial [Planctomycetes bacterium]|nr:hypothetical protein [Planctomycetota bacterium]